MADWLEEHLDPSDTIFLKLNCEGAEVPILLSLFDSGHIKWIDEMAIEFDCAKVPSFADGAAKLLDLLDDMDNWFDFDINVHDPDAKLAYWLEPLQEKYSWLRKL